MNKDELEVELLDRVQMFIEDQIYSYVIEEIEEFLALTANRQQFTAQEIQDLLLDLRNIAEHDSCVSIAETIVPEKEIANPAGGTT